MSDPQTATGNAPGQASPRTEQPMIEADRLSKFYGIFAATREVSFKVYAGEVVAFLGPNGAGKSTTMKLLTGYLAPSTGVARIAGFDMATERIEAAKRLGYVHFPQNISGRANTQLKACTQSHCRVPNLDTGYLLKQKSNRP